MIRLKHLLKEVALNDTQLKDKNLTVGKIIGNVYFSTESSKVDLSRDIHVGDADQAYDRADMTINHYQNSKETVPNVYIFKMILVLQNPCPKILWDVDKNVGHTKEDFLKYGNYNEFAYLNKGEGDTSSKRNISFYIIDPKRSLSNITLIEILRTDN